jgi:hypothetical protein
VINIKTERLGALAVDASVTSAIPIQKQ